MLGDTQGEASIEGRLHGSLDRDRKHIADCGSEPAHCLSRAGNKLNMGGLHDGTPRGTEPGTTETCSLFKY